MLHVNSKTVGPILFEETFKKSLDYSNLWTYEIWKGSAVYSQGIVKFTR